MHINFQQNSPACPLGGQTINPAFIKVKRRKGGIAAMITNIGSLTSAKGAEKGALHRRSGNAVSRLLLAASLAWIGSPADAQQAWQPYGSIMHSLQQAKGATITNPWDDNSELFDTSSELLTSKLTFTVYKAPPSTNEHDYYLVAGPFSHAVTSATNKGNGSGWTTFSYSSNGSVYSGAGWCGANMDLTVTGSTSDGITPTAVYQFGPGSAGATETKSTQVGIGASESGLSANYNYSITWDAPDVAIYSYNTSTTANNTPYNNVLKYSAGISTCSLLSANNPSSWYTTPDPVSQFGTEMQIAILYEVPHGDGLQVNWNNDVWWHFFTENTATNGSFTDDNQVNQNLSGAGTFVADFGAAPIYNPGNKVVSANGPQIVDAYGYCLTAQRIEGPLDWPVARQPCDHNHKDTTQNWYYTGYSQIVNVSTGTCLDIQGGFTQGGTPVAGSQLITTPCAPALPTAACTANGTCATTGTVVSQQWQLTSSPSVSTSPTALYLMSSSGYAVNANPKADPASKTYTVEPANLGTCFVLPLNAQTTPNPVGCSNTPAP